MTETFAPCYIKMKDPNIEFKQECFVCVVDGVVIGNIGSITITGDHMMAFLPNWENFQKILSSENHQFIKSERCIVLGTLWNGTEFIAPNENVPETGTF